ncbi:3D domain-containing protein [Butyricicoccus sp.]|uniref:3D domain-containing protein n=1 Tax=Butyricicoccus sp. TaxID=2049021 RepID=UPI003D7CF2D0
MKNKFFQSHDSSQNQKSQLFQQEKVSSTGDVFSKNLHQEDFNHANASEQKPLMADILKEIGMTIVDDPEQSHSQQESSLTPDSQAQSLPGQTFSNPVPIETQPSIFHANHDNPSATQPESIFTSNLASPHESALSDHPAASLIHSSEPLSGSDSHTRPESIFASSLASPHESALSDHPAASLVHPSEPLSSSDSHAQPDSIFASSLASPHESALSDHPAASLVHPSEPLSGSDSHAQPESIFASSLASPHESALSDSPVASLVHPSEPLSSSDSHDQPESIFASSLASPHESALSDSPVASLVHTSDEIFDSDFSSQSENRFTSSLISDEKEGAIDSDPDFQPESTFASSLLSSDTTASKEQLKHDSLSHQENTFSSNLLNRDSTPHTDESTLEYAGISPKEKAHSLLVSKSKHDTVHDLKTPADSIAPSRADIYADSLSSSSPKKSRLKDALYHNAIRGGGASEEYADRAAAAERRTIVTGAAMTYSASKKVAKAAYRQGKFAFLSHKDRKDGILTDKKSILLKNGRFAAKQGKELFKDAGKRLAHEGLLVAEDIEGSEDLGMQAVIKTKNVVRDTSRMASGAKRLFGKNKPKQSFLQVLRQTPSAVSKVVANTGHTFSKAITGIAKMSRSFGVIAIISLFLVVTLLAMPVAYAVVGAASLASDDETLTEVYTYITELDAKLSKKINGYSSKADVVSYTYNGAETIDPITITTNPDPILNYLDCVYGDYKFSDVKSAIDDIYSAVYKIDVSEYVQDVSGTSEADKKTTTDTVVDKDDTQDGTSTDGKTDEKKDTDLILTYTPTYGGIVSKKPGSTLTTAILNNSKCLGQFKLTFYCGCPICSEQWGTQTATGVTATEGRTIAVDPKVIPYGTKVHIDGFGDFIAEDCGGAIKGNRIDIFVSDHQRCNNLGVQYAAVYAMNSNVTGGIYIPGISKNEVKHMDVNVTSETLITYLQN